MDGQIEIDMDAAPTLDPQLVRILQSFDKLKLPPLSAEVTQYLESGAHGPTLLERRRSFAEMTEEVRAKLLDKLKKGGPWTKMSTESKKFKKEAVTHVQIPRPSGTASPEGLSTSSPASPPTKANSLEQTGSPTSVLPSAPEPSAKHSNPFDSSNQVALTSENLQPTAGQDSDDSEKECTDAQRANTKCAFELDLGLPTHLRCQTSPPACVDTTPSREPDLSLPTHLRCQTSSPTAVDTSSGKEPEISMPTHLQCQIYSRAGQYSLPSSPFRSVTPTRSPLGNPSRTSRSFPSSPDSAEFDPNSADERNRALSSSDPGKPVAHLLRVPDSADSDQDSAADERNRALSTSDPGKQTMRKTAHLLKTPSRSFPPSPMSSGTEWKSAYTALPMSTLRSSSQSAGTRTQEQPGSRSPEDKQASTKVERSSAHLERNSAHLERSLSEPIRTVPHRRRTTGLRRALSTAFKRGHVDEPEPLMDEAASNERHLLAPPKKLPPAVRRRASSDPQPADWSRRYSAQESARRKSEPGLSSETKQTASNEGLGQISIGELLQEQAQERLGTVNKGGDKKETSMDSEDLLATTSLSWKPASKKGEGCARRLSFDASRKERDGNEDEWLKSIDMKAMTTLFCRQSNNTVEGSETVNKNETADDRETVNKSETVDLNETLEEGFVDLGKLEGEITVTAVEDKIDESSAERLEDIVAAFERSAEREKWKVPMRQSLGQKRPLEIEVRKILAAIKKSEEKNARKEAMIAAAKARAERVPEATESLSKADESVGKIAEEESLSKSEDSVEKVPEEEVEAMGSAEENGTRERLARAREAASVEALVGVLWNINEDESVTGSADSTENEKGEQQILQKVETQPFVEKELQAISEERGSEDDGAVSEDSLDEKTEPEGKEEHLSLEKEQSESSEVPAVRTSALAFFRAAGTCPDKRSLLFLPSHSEPTANGHNSLPINPKPPSDSALPTLPKLSVRSGVLPQTSEQKAGEIEINIPSRLAERVVRKELLIARSSILSEAERQVPSNPEEYEALQLKEALPSIYKSGHFIHRPYNKRAQLLEKTGGTSESARYGQAGKQYKLQWRQDTRIDEEQYQRALFGTVEV